MAGQPRPPLQLTKEWHGKVKPHSTPGLNIVFDLSIVFGPKQDLEKTY